MGIKGNKGKIRRAVVSIPAPPEIPTDLLRFSFKYLELEHEKFDLPNTQQKNQYLARLLECLKSISSMKLTEFTQAGKALRSHSINWEGTTEPNGYSHLPQQLQQCMPWQLSLSRDNLGRVHGFLLADVFYPVWVDHGHKLYT